MGRIFMKKIELKERNHFMNILETIDFFSQVLHPEQLEEYGYLYIHNLLMLQRSMIFMKNTDGDKLILKKTINVSLTAYEIELTENVKELATKVGVVVHGDLQRYLPSELFAHMEATMLLPLIVGEELIGFVITDSWEGASPEDYTFVEAVKKMINNAFYTGIQMIENRNFKQQTDRKIYDQMLLHQIVRMLLSELDIEELQKICVDSMRELTASAQTGLLLHDPQVGRLCLKHYEDLRHYRKAYGELEWSENHVPKRMVYEFSVHKEELLDAMGKDGVKFLEQIGTRYIVLLKKNPVIGFLTLGDAVGGQQYTHSTLEMAESIMGTVCIAIENAHNHLELKLKHKQISASLQAMKTLSQSLEVINTATDLEELSSLMAQDLSLHLGLGKCLVAKRSGDHYEVLYSSEPSLVNLRFAMRSEGEEGLGRGLVLDFRRGGLGAYIDSASLLNSFDEQTLLVDISSPSIIEGEKDHIGLILGSDFGQEIGQFELSYIEALSKGAAPLFKRHYIEASASKVCGMTDLERFMGMLLVRDEEQSKYWMPYRLYYKKTKWQLRHLEEVDPLDQHIHRLGNTLFAFHYVESLDDTSGYDGYFEGSYEEVLLGVEDYLNQ